MFYALLILALVAVAPFLREFCKPRMNDRARQSAPGQFADLPQGRTHYQWHGPKDGPVIVCVHGLTTPSYVWDWMMPDMVAAGFRVLTYDLYGRGFSDRPVGVHDHEFYRQQLRDLLADQGVVDGFTLLGYSMGGSIVTVFTAADPARVGRLVLLAPAGMHHVPGKFADFVRETPYVGDWLNLVFARRVLVKGAGKSADGALGETLAKRQDVEASRYRYLAAVLASQRGLLANSLEEMHRDIAATGVPTTAIWGEVDGVIPLSARDVLAGWADGVDHIVIAGAGHALGMTHPGEVSAAILKH